jgi:predicted nucleotidyltransferase
MESAPRSRRRFADFGSEEETAMKYHGIEPSKQVIAEFCRKYGIRRLSLFGSVLGDDFGPESDVDVLVEFEPGAVVTLLDMSRMQEELSRVFSHPVDLRTPQELSRYFRDKVLAAAVVQYAA